MNKEDYEIEISDIKSHDEIWIKDYSMIRAIKTIPILEIKDEYNNVSILYAYNGSVHLVDKKYKLSYEEILKLNKINDIEQQISILSDELKRIKELK